MDDDAIKPTTETDRRGRARVQTRLVRRLTEQELAERDGESQSDDERTSAGEPATEPESSRGADFEPDRQDSRERGDRKQKVER